LHLAVNLFISFPPGFGRKFALFFAAFWFFLGSLLQTFPTLNGQSPASSLIQLYVGRAIGGFGVGVVSVVVPTYISESAPKHLRGRLTGMYQLAIVFGIAFSFWVNYGLLNQFGENANKPIQWKIAFGLQMLPGGLLVASMLTQSESPRWLAEKGRHEEARIVLAKLRGLPVDHEVVHEEFMGIKDDFEGKEKLTMWQQFGIATSSKKMFYRCSLPFIFMAFQQWTGVNSMNYVSDSGVVVGTSAKHIAFSTPLSSSRSLVSRELRLHFSEQVSTAL